MAVLLLRHWCGSYLRQTRLEPIHALEMEAVLGDVGLGHVVVHGGGRRPGVLWVADLIGRLRFQCN